MLAERIASYVLWFTAPLVQVGIAAFMLREKLHRLLRRDPEAAALGVRRLVHRMARIFQASLLLEEADQDLTANRPTRLPEIARFFVSRYVEPGYDPAEDPGYGELIRQIVE